MINMRKEKKEEKVGEERNYGEKLIKRENMKE